MLLAAKTAKTWQPTCHVLAVYLILYVCGEQNKCQLKSISSDFGAVPIVAKGLSHLEFLDTSVDWSYKVVLLQYLILFIVIK